MAYLQRILQATLTTLLSLTAVILAAFGISESLRLAGVERNQNILITFLVSLALLLLALWLLRRPLLALKTGGEQGYIQRVLLFLAFTWATIAVLLIVNMGLYVVLGAVGVERIQNLLTTFLVSLALLLLVLWLLRRPLLTLKEKYEL